ncbi:MAG: hypothetical protein AMXMBFR57_16420 [Acidimicrobiia bacterium]
MFGPMRMFLGLTLATAVVTASAQQQTPPQFRAGVAVTRLEVTVLDKRTRAPITGLSADDFVVKVNGRVQPVVSLAEVTVPGAAGNAAPGIVEATRDVSTNELTSPRIFVVIMNDAVGGRDPFYRNNGKAIANRFIDLLGPNDLASVIFVRDNRHAQDLAQDRTLLRRAIDEYRPIGFDFRMSKAMTTKVLLNTLEFLRPLSNYRRAVAFISPAIDSDEEVETDDLAYYLQDIDTFRDLSVISTIASLSHVPVYTFSAQGIQAPTGGQIATTASGRRLLLQYDVHLDTLRTIANLTGGRATVATNTPADRVPDMFNELSSYYALAYEQTDPADGRLRRLDVQVNRPDAMVISSRLVLAPNEAAPTSRANSAGASRTGLMAALESPVPLGALPLRLAAIPLAVTGSREQAVALTLGLPPVSAAEQFRIRVLVYDGEGRRQFLDTGRVVDLPRATDAEGSELVIRASLRPGRYNVRVATERASDTVAGTVHATIDVPDFEREPLSLSGVAIGRGDSRRIGGRQEIEGLLPFPPTAVRAFAPSDRVGALVRVHQGANRPAAVTMTTSITDSMGAVLFTRADALAPTAFADGTAEHRFELPLTAIRPGTYLLRFVAVAGKHTAQREVRFSVR